MLKKFFFNLLSSFMGAWLAIVTSGICLVLVCIGIAGAFMSNRGFSDDYSVLKIELKGELTERDGDIQLDLLSLIQNNGQVKYLSVETLLAAIREAENNDKIKAIYLDCGQLLAAPASLNTVRAALLRFKKSKKHIYAYADSYSQSAYFLATAADELYLNPIGSVGLSGLGGESLFYKDLYDKIGVEFQVVRVGKGKSAVEPYTQNHMSDYARRQSMQLLDTIWSGIKDEVASSRGIKAADIDTLINNDFPALRTASYALKHNLIDGTMYRHEFEKHIADAVGDEDLDNTISPRVLADMHNALSGMANSSDNQIAVLYACGGIDTDMDGGIQSQKIAKQIIELADDDNIKGLVLRVNSPGGSAYGSEQIWKAIETFKTNKKTVAVSMGDYAASGGYYISSGANRIFADKLTITGSIGIFGLIPNIRKLTEMIGLNAEMVATNPQAQFPTLLDSLDNRQLAAMQSMVEEGYELFVKRCADGRHLPVNKIKAIADGRPLPATMALRNGLVDQIGSLNDAVEWVAAKAGIKDDYNVGVYPQREPNFMFLLDNMQQSKLPSSLQSLLKKHNWDVGMMRLLNNVIRTDRVRAEYNLVRIKM